MNKIALSRTDICLDTQRNWINFNCDFSSLTKKDHLYLFPVDERISQTGQHVSCISKHNRGKQFAIDLRITNLQGITTHTELECDAIDTMTLSYEDDVLGAVAAISLLLLTVGLSLWSAFWNQSPNLNIT